MKLEDKIAYTVVGTVYTIAIGYGLLKYMLTHDNPKKENDESHKSFNEKQNHVDDAKNAWMQYRLQRDLEESEASKHDVNNCSDESWKKFNKIIQKMSPEELDEITEWLSDQDDK